MRSGVGFKLSRALILHAASTEQSRASMSKALQSEFTAKNLDQSIIEIDVKCKDECTDTDRGVSIGPFGAFMLPRQTLPPRLCVDADIGSNDSAGDDVPNLSTSQDVSESGLNNLPSVGSFGSFEDMDHLLQWNDLFDLDFPEANGIPMAGVPADMGATFAFPADQWHLGGKHPGEAEYDEPSQDHQRDTTADAIGADGDSPALKLLVNESFTSKTSELLLRYFKDQVVDHMSTMPVPKRSPWEILNLEASMLTFMRLGFPMPQQISNASVANFMALLALSATHLAAQPLERRLIDPEGVSQWCEVSEKAASQAKKCLQLSLQHELYGPQHAKYKDQLMAILAMLTFSVGKSTFHF